jgi:hypothetical protein
MPRPRRLFFADVQTPLSLTPHGYAALPDHDMALQQHTDQGMVFRVAADTAQHAAEQVIGLIGKDAVIGALYDAEQVIAGSEPIAWVAGQLDPRLLPPLLQSDQPPDLPALPDDPPSDHDGGGGGWGQGWDADPGGGWSWQ